MVANATVLSGRVANLVIEGDTERLVDVLAAATVGDGARTVVVNDAGILLADTDASAQAGEQFATEERPEFAAASAGQIDVRQRHSDTLDDDLLLVTVPVTDKGDVIGALRLSTPMTAVDASVRSSWLALLLIGIAVVGAGLVLAWILAGSMARPVEKLRTAAGRLGRGDLDAASIPRARRARRARAVVQQDGRRAPQPERPARLRRQRLPPAPHAADGDQAPTRGDPQRGRRRRGGGRQGGSGARPAERARRRPALACSGPRRRRP